MENNIKIIKNIEMKELLKNPNIIGIKNKHTKIRKNIIVKIEQFKNLKIKSPP